MTAKTTPPNGLFDDGPRGNDRPDRARGPMRSSARRLVSRIADALQVPEAVLYDPPHALVLARGADLEEECAALLHAYRRIGDIGARRRLLVLAEVAADQA